MTDLFDEDKSEEQQPGVDENSNGRIYVVFLIILLPVYFFVRHFGGPDRALTVFLSLATVMVAAGICWDLRNRLWFWVVTVLLLGLHIPLVIMLHWPHYWIPGVVLTPIGLLDILIMVKIIRFVQKYIVRDVPNDGTE